MDSKAIDKRYKYAGSATVENATANKTLFDSFINVGKLLGQRKDSVKYTTEIAFDSAMFIHKKDMYDFVLMVYSHYADRQDRTFDQEVFFKKAEEIINNINHDFNQIKPKKI